MSDANVQSGAKLAIRSVFGIGRGPGAETESDTESDTDADNGDSKTQSNHPLRAGKANA